MHIAERKTREMLDAYGATFVRLSSNGHEMWELPNKRKFVCQRPGSSGDWRAWNNSLAELKRALTGCVPRVRKVEIAELPCPGCHGMARLTELGLCQECTDNGIPDKPKGGVELIHEVESPVESPVMGPVEVDDAPMGTTMMNKWSKADLERLEQLFRDGLSDDKIAEELCRSARAVVKRRTLMGLRRPPGRKPKEGNVTKKKTKKTRKKWSDADDKKLRELTDKGLEDADIAKQLGVTRTAVGARRSRLGLMKRGHAKKVAAKVELPRRPTPEGDCTIRLQYPGGQTLEGAVSRDLADELALRILAGEA